mmetsp:Transcript_13694/g.27142  ORF Transcript_13694/g.27142 Transcript_13694/m.27142 type:complete len:210 (+) Transcript_13694:285-914(+)
MSSCRSHSRKCCSDKAAQELVWPSPCSYYRGSAEGYISKRCRRHRVKAADVGGDRRPYNKPEILYCHVQAENSFLNDFTERGNPISSSVEAVPLDFCTQILFDHLNRLCEPLESGRQEKRNLNKLSRLSIINGNGRCGCACTSCGSGEDPSDGEVRNSSDLCCRSNRFPAASQRPSAGTTGTDLVCHVSSNQRRSRSASLWTATPAEVA